MATNILIITDYAVVIIQRILSLERALSGSLCYRFPKVMVLPKVMVYGDWDIYAVTLCCSTAADQSRVSLSWRRS
jgi:hypothetical protein